MRNRFVLRILYQVFVQDPILFSLVFRLNWQKSLQKIHFFNNAYLIISYTAAMKALVISFYSNPTVICGHR